MRAVRVHDSDDGQVISVEAVRRPKPGRNQALIRVFAAGVHLLETHSLSGANVKKVRGAYTPGIEASGVIEALGGPVRFGKGQPVYCIGTLTGACAEFALCDLNQIYAKPERLSFVESSVFGVTYAAAIRSLDMAHPKKGEIVLVHGASGGVGLAAVQVARLAGLRVIGSAGSEDGRSLVAGKGAHHVLDHSDPCHIEQMLKLTNGHGADVILEMRVNVNIENDSKALAPCGCLILIGGFEGLDLSPIRNERPDARIETLRLFDAKPVELRNRMMELHRHAECGELRPMIIDRTPLEQADYTFRCLPKWPRLGRSVLVP